MSFLQKTQKFDYFDAFSKLAADASAAAVFLNEAITDFQYIALPNYVKRIHTIENHADTIKHDIVQYLAHEFITPIEREDIVVLAQDLDSVVDSIDEVLRRMYMFDVHSIRLEAMEFTQLIVKCCGALASAVSEFRRFKSSNTLNDRLIEVNTFESRGDELHLSFLHRLFHENVDAKEALAWSTIYETMEKCCDACEDAADTLECVIMKNT